ncbi:energy-coupling factor transporter ATPase [Alkalibacillus haloalkaliphilus]|uniref:energy-coupling factor transporter ATPase n=1 Tax=Alkalibacillus haloalkaliphilus TaxID=94136 RepID=UPI002936BCEC|nr:energy-coupling factor transporter ATPase [Alkalibacillus haloalkaliphilus]MDV2582641.1 energy-coupling factor transporter ATPase [Alkalibacillus haloalkaliphilus]
MLLLIQFDQVSFQYKPNTPYVLNDINLTVSEGEWVSILGQNGSGKSTAAKLINGLLRPIEGRVIIGDIEITDETVYQVRRQVGMVFQNPENQFVGTTVLDDVAFGLENIGVPREEMIDRIDQSLKQVGMLEYKNHEPTRLSGGQKQRVAIASVLAMKPKIIVFDEATSMLDPVGKKEIIETMQYLHKHYKLTIIMITHDLNEAAYSDHVITLHKGRVWLQGTPRNLFQYGEKLEEVGLEPTLVTKVYQSLKRESFHIKEEPIHFKELVDELWTLYLKT